MNSGSKVYGHWEWGIYPVQQCFQETGYSEPDAPIHMLDRVDRWGTRYFRCGDHDWTGDSYKMTTTDAPTCPGCIQWFEDYLNERQLLLPFPNGYDENGFWIHIPSLLRPIPGWAEKLKKSS